jgi:Tol biopolymer transport system component
MFLNRQERFPVLRRRGDVLLVGVATFGLIVVTAEFPMTAAEPAGGPQIEIYAMDADGRNHETIWQGSVYYRNVAPSPDGRDIAFIAPAADGFFQLFRMPIDGGAPVQVTTDRTHKTQPAWSPDGRQLAFTVWNYDAQFWTIR